MSVSLLLLGGIGALSAAAGIGGHITAKETNEKAESINRDAKRLYDNAKTSLESYQNNAKSSLNTLEKKRNDIANSSIKVFMDALQHVRLDEINSEDFSKYGANLDDSFLIELRKMQGVYSSSLSTGLTGVAIGSAVAIASSGMLPIISSTLSLAAGALSFGGIGAATTLAGSALSMAASATPLAAIAAPVMLFTAFSANDKADENLEKANANYAEVEASVAQMATQETLCNAIIERANLLIGVLSELDSYFSPLTGLFSRIVSSRCEDLQRNNLNPKTDLNESEQKIMAATHSIFQSIISFFKLEFFDTEGQLSLKFNSTYNDESKKLLGYSETSNSDSIAAEAKSMIQKEISKLTVLNSQLKNKLEALKEICTDYETQSEINKVTNFVSNVVNEANQTYSINYYGDFYSANNAFIDASKKCREIENVSLTLNSVLQLTEAKIAQMSSYNTYYHARERTKMMLDDINSIRKKFVDTYITSLLCTYQNLNNFTPYGIDNYINTDKSKFTDIVFLDRKYDLISFSIIPENEESARQIASDVNVYNKELDSVTKQYVLLWDNLQKYSALFNSKSTDVFIKISEKVQRMISQKSYILGISDLQPINFNKKEKKLLSLSLISYENIKKIFSFEIIKNDGTVNKDTSYFINSINSDAVNLSYSYSSISNVDYSQSPLNARMNTLLGNVIVLISIIAVALLILFIFISSLPKLIIVMIILVIIICTIIGIIRIKSNSQYNL